MKKGLFLYLLLLILLFTSCKHSNHSIYQLSTIEMLMTGNYDGQKSIESLSKKGDFGIGTFSKLDGEMIVYKGIVYKAKSDGTVKRADATETSPYASVCHFCPTIEFNLSNIRSLAILDSAIKRHLPKENAMYALEITGILDTIKVRSVSKQTKPYRALVDVVKNQATFLSTNIEGTLVGFYAPSTVKSIMVQGMHLHFLSKDEKKGGHVLAISTTQNIHCRIACYTKLHLDMVEMSEATNKVGFNKKDMQESIEKVEK